MLYLYIVVTLLLAPLLIYAAIRKLSHRPDVVASYARVGVPEQWLNFFALLLMAGAAGVVAGILIKPAGLAASGCLVGYFTVAAAAHVRHRDLANIVTPVSMLFLSAAALALRLVMGGL